MSDETLSRFDSPVPPRTIADFLYPVPAARRPGAIIRWWEARRIPFNLIVGASGVVSLGIISLISILPPSAHGFSIPFLAIVVYGVLANLCYSLGPTVELTVEKLSGGRVLPTGPLLLRAGLTFSVGLTLVLPVILVVIGWIVRVIGLVV
jgi:hypothetical protein